MIIRTINLLTLSSIKRVYLAELENNNYNSTDIKPVCLF